MSLESVLELALGDLKRIELAVLGDGVHPLALWRHVGVAAHTGSEGVRRRQTAPPGRLRERERESHLGRDCARDEVAALALSTIKGLHHVPTQAHHVNVRRAVTHDEMIRIRGEEGHSVDAHLRTHLPRRRRDGAKSQGRARVRGASVRAHSGRAHAHVRVRVGGGWASGIRRLSVAGIWPCILPSWHPTRARSHHSSR